MTARVLEVALRDTMVTAYAAALEGQSDAHPPQDLRMKMVWARKTGYVGVAWDRIPYNGHKLLWHKLSWRERESRSK